jgi:predicted O-methyltransferase YrrM
MGQEQWTAVDEYVGGLLAPHDDALDAALRASEEAGLPTIQVSPPQGKLLQLLAQTLDARTVLEFGTLGGYSTIWLGRALPADGRLITLEADPEYAEVARRSVERAELGDVVEIRVGPALETLPSLEVEGAGPFDLVFIDADKVNTPNYFIWALEHSRPGGLIIADNVVRAGALADADSDDPTIPAQRRFHEMLAAEPRVSATTHPSRRHKGPRRLHNRSGYPCRQRRLNKGQRAPSGAAPPINDPDSRLGRSRDGESFGCLWLKPVCASAVMRRTRRVGCE